MKKLLILLAMGAVLLPALFFSGSSVKAAIPHLINYQGMLTESDGTTPVADDQYNLGFKIYGSQSGDDSLWWEYHLSVQVTNGLFNVILGSQSTLNLPFDAEYWLETIVETEIMPTRLQFTSVGYAYRAKVADSAAVAGSGVSSGGWVDDGTVVRLESAADSVGIGTADPAQELDVVGTVQMTGFKMSTGASNGYVLTSDGSGVGTWQAAGAGADNDWTFRITDTADTTLITGGAWGIARYGNTLYGNADSTHVNLGVACTTGTSGQNYKYCTVGGGYLNTASDSYATVGGGYGNTGSGNHAAVGGGRNNLVEGDYSAITGGYADTITSTAHYSYLFGIGSKLTADSTFMVDMPYIRFGDETNGYEFPTSDGSNGQVMATNGSGQLSWTTVSGAGDNDWAFRITDTADTTLITGGAWGIARYGNTLHGNADSTHVNLGVACTTGTSGQNYKYCTVGGGVLNTASGDYATVGGGVYNTASGEYATVPGGRENTASGNHSFVAGRRAKANHNGTFVWADSTDADFSSTGDNQFLIRASGGVGIGTNNPQGALEVNSTTGAFIVPRMTTAQRDALTPVNGMIIYNTTTNEFHFYENGAWVTK